jgi:demethylmenaquinone methyltransferase/2-methoxy-6-polyprenyl-1,4-benzoquinol methylase
MTVDDVLASQRRYYATRAPEYDDWWFRRGRYALEPDAEALWREDIEEVEAALEAFQSEGRIVELAAGTGLWTRHLARLSDSVLAVDASVEMIELNRARVDGSVEYQVADVFEWRPGTTFDLCFFSFWLSHVPEQRFDEFWRLVRSSLEPAGRVFLVDSGAGDAAHTLRADDGECEVRRVSDGREFEIVKRYWTPETLAKRVAPLGFRLDLRQTRNGSFLYGGGS